MDIPDNDASKTLEYLYKEYVRISDLCNSYTKSRYDDLKLLGAIGILLAWKPITDLISPPNAPSSNPDKIVDSPVLLFGFIAVLFLVSILGIRDLLKESLIQYGSYQLRFYEEEIRALLGHSDTHSFRLATDWEQWNKQKFQPIAVRFNLLFFLAVMIFPIVVLATSEQWWQTAIYATIALLILAIYLSAVRTLNRGTK